ncbi:MAG: hypothetical protein QOD42_2768 [Sphingomonadales bacterium]|jgi:hypothetical protein|nr:hypothetical protein [Sphingomonadales bacterium]
MKRDAFSGDATPPQPSPIKGEGEPIERVALDILNFLNLSGWTAPFPPR